MMNDHMIAFIRTMMPMIFGLIVGAGAYLIFTYISPMVLALITLIIMVGVVIYLFITMFEHNLRDVKRERESARTN